MKSKWSSEEDKRLGRLVCEFRQRKWTETSWDEISKLLGSKRTPTQCRQSRDLNENFKSLRDPNRFQNFIDIDKNKEPWTTEEDRLLIEAVEKHGKAANWSKIAGYVVGRKGKQCRERYHNHLSPGVIKAPWTEDEDRQIILMQSKYGNGWAGICHHLPGRTDNAIKNRWNCSLKLHVLNFFRELNGMPKSRSVEEPIGFQINVELYINEILAYIQRTKSKREMARSKSRSYRKRTLSVANTDRSTSDTTTTLSFRSPTSKDGKENIFNDVNLVESYLPSPLDDTVIDSFIEKESVMNNTVADCTFEVNARSPHMGESHSTPLGSKNVSRKKLNTSAKLSMLTLDRMFVDALENGEIDPYESFSSSEYPSDSSIIGWVLDESSSSYWSAVSKRRAKKRKIDI